MNNAYENNVAIVKPVKRNSFSTKGMFGWVRNSRIAAIFGIRIVVVYPNTNLLFRNSDNNCYSVVMMK
jgi:hypothetical protein